jgi:hypothetical protein
MHHSIEVSSYMGLAAVTLCGEVSATDRLQVLDETLGRLEADRRYGILIDLQRARAMPDTFEACNHLATRLAEEPRLRDCRVAYVYSESACANPMIERLAAARRFRFRRFFVVSEAIDWLLTPRWIRPAAHAEPSAPEVLARLRRTADG